MERRALLVNDSKFESMILRDMLENLGYEVEISNEFEALSTFELYEPHVVIANYIMEETRGDQLIYQLKIGHPETICLLSSSNLLRLSDFKPSLVDGVLKTPISKYILESTLKRYMDESGEDAGLCPNCHKDIHSFGDTIAFCPFCGHPIR